MDQRENRSRKSCMGENNMNLPGNGRFGKKENWRNQAATFTDTSLIIGGHSVIESWETGYMKRLAEIATHSGGDILEVGFGLGTAASFIQKNPNVRTHTIIECHPEVARKCRKAYAEEIKNGKVILCEAFWEDMTLTWPGERFDGILFDTYPLSEEEAHKNHFFFFKEAHRLLKKDGIFTYYSDEEQVLSKGHLGKLSEAGFTRIASEVCPVAVPATCNYWDKDTIVSPIIRK